MRSEDKRVVAATVGDIHARADRPRCRAEKDWYAVMQSHFEQLRKILIKHKGPPLFYAGDIFHKWNSPPELINFLLANMPEGYAIPGNHDLPYHNYEDKKKSAYWTLVKARKLIDLTPGQIVTFPDIKVIAFPFGSEPHPPTDPDVGHVKVALIHAYCWKDGHAFPGVPQEQHRAEWQRRLTGYTGLVFGDNHSPFTHGNTNQEQQDSFPWVRNGGCFMRQTTTEIDYFPTVGLIWSDGTLTQEKLDRRSDQFNPPDSWDFEGTEQNEEAMQNLLEELTNVGKHRQDFGAALRRAADKSTVSPEVRRLVLEFMGEGM